MERMRSGAGGVERSVNEMSDAYIVGGINATTSALPMYPGGGFTPHFIRLGENLGYRYLPCVTLYHHHDR
jgi:hypothetical protein